MSPKTTSLGIIMATAALCITLGANVLQLIGVHASLQQMIERQQESEPAVARVNAQLDALASATQRLAEGGDANAAKIIATLGENGIKIKSAH